MVMESATLEVVSGVVVEVRSQGGEAEDLYLLL